MVNYEVALTLRSAAKKADLVASLKRICTLMMGDGTIIKSMENLGNNRLPYKISAHKERFETGWNFLMDVEAPPTYVLPLRQKLTLDSDVIRATVLKKSD